MSFFSFELSIYM